MVDEALRRKDVNMTTNVKLMVVFSKILNVFHMSLAKNLDELGMNSSMYIILAHLNEVGQARTQKLGEIAMITSGTITHMVNKMLKAAFVDKVQDEEDKRVFWIKITDSGRHAFSRVDEAHMVYLDALLEDFTEEEKKLLIEQMKHFGKKVNEKGKLLEIK